MPTSADLERLFDQPEEKIDLGRAALLVARTEFPGLQPGPDLHRLDSLAAEARPHLALQADPAGRVEVLRDFLSGLCGFRGNEKNYHDPANSCLNRVLQRRTGIPITLSVVYMEVGRRAGLPLFGVGLPGHFLVKYQDRQERIFVDPFHHGRILSAAGCRSVFESLHEGRVAFDDQMLAAVDKRSIVLRMLHNLRRIYLEKKQLRKALAVEEMVLALNPASADDLKLRGLLHCQLGHHREGRQDLESYLSTNPDASDAGQIRQTIRELTRVSVLRN